MLSSQRLRWHKIIAGDSWQYVVVGSGEGDAVCDSNVFNYWMGSFRGRYDRHHKGNAPLKKV